MFQRMLLKAEGKTNKLLCTIGTFDFIKAEAAGKFPRVNMIVYTGGLLMLEGLDYPVVIDLSSTAFAPVIPLLWSHNREIILGERDSGTITATEINSTGILSGQGEKANEVRQMMLDGQKLNVSAGTLTENMVFVPESQSRVINGQSFNGPFYHAMDNTVKEISLLAIGADTFAFATLLAATFSMGDMKMFDTFEQFLSALSLDVKTMSEADKVVAQKIYDNLKTKAAEIAAKAKETAKEGNTPPTVVDVQAEMKKLLTSGMTEYKNGIAAETERVDKIKSLGSTYSNPTMLLNGGKVNIVTHAITEGWTVLQAENAMLKNARPTNVNAGGRNAGNGDGNVDSYTLLAAAIAVTGKISKPERFFTPQQLDAAHKEYKGRIGLQQLIIEAAYLNGYTGKPHLRGNLKAILQAAFSTIDIANVLTNTANKFLMEGFNGIDPSWRLMAAIGSVSDFKEIAGYRGVGSFRFEAVAPDGHIPHGTISNTGYGNKADTYAKMLGITRQDMINDDLNVLTGVPRGLGRGGAMALLHAFWTEFMDNSAFFAAGNNNLTAGALGLTGLATAVAKFGKQTDENGDYVLATPRYLVVPTELEPTAMDLYSQLNLVGGGTTTFGQNRYVGKYQPISSPYLSDTRFTGNSTTAYYLIADPNDIPVIEVVFLDGQETPTVETADVDFDQLGIQMRGYFDFGVRKQEFRGGVKSTGV